MPPGGRGLLLSLSLVAGLASLPCMACGGAEAETPIGASTARPAAQPVELELRTTDGAFVAIGDLRGRPTIIFLFATFDGVSQAAVRPLARFVRHHPEVYVVAIAAQPNPALFAEAWQEALAPPFVVAYDPEEQVTEGTTPLGHIGAVPTYVVLGANGVEVARHIGFASQNQLEHLVLEASDGD